MADAKGRRKEAPEAKVAAGVTMRYAGARRYSGDDKAAGVSSLVVDSGKDVSVSEAKAAQLARDFPEDWDLIEAPSAEVEERIAGLLAAGRKRRVSARSEAENRRRAASAARGEPKTVFRSPADGLVEAIRDGRTRVVKITTSELLDTIKQPGYVGLNAYAHATGRPEPNEIGANHAKNVRYVVMKSGDAGSKKKAAGGAGEGRKKNEGKKKAGEPARGEESSVKEYDGLDGSVPAPRQSRDRDVDDASMYDGVPTGDED